MLKFLAVSMMIFSLGALACDGGHGKSKDKKPKEQQDSERSI